MKRKYIRPEVEEIEFSINEEITVNVGEMTSVNHGVGEDIEEGTE